VPVPDPVRRTVTREGRPLALSVKESALRRTPGGPRVITTTPGVGYRIGS
jgi:hypothetical protein